MIERIVPIVEGHGEVSAVPVLLRRLLVEMNKGHVQISQPDRNPRSTLVQPGGIEFVVQRAADNSGPSGAILILLDSDDDPPCVLGPQLMRRAVSSRSDRRVMIALAEVEFETWFLASAESLAGKNRLSSSLARPENFEKISGAKEWLTKQMIEKHTYKPKIDQARLTAAFDLDLARQHSHSFRRFCARFRELISA